LERDLTEYDTVETSKFIKEGQPNELELDESGQKKPFTQGNQRNPQKEQRTFKLSMKKTLPKPTDISNDDKAFLLPKLTDQN
jgi:hypothetical protein